MAASTSHMQSFKFNRPFVNNGLDTEMNSGPSTRITSSANTLCDAPGTIKDFNVEKKDIDPKKQGPELQPLETEPPYHVFSRRRKKEMVYIVSLAGLFSPLSSNIFFPALGSVARDFNISLATAAFTVTVYMVVQGLAPSFWCAFSDSMGRRPIMIATFVVYLAANIGLAFVKNFAGFMVLRGVQAAGSAATISIGAGVIGDITTPAERGGLVGVFGGMRMMGQSIGPVLGGILNEYLNYRSIFWFLFIAGGISLALVILLLPETLRTVAGNGSVRLVGVQKPLIYYFKPQPDVQTEAQTGKIAGVKLSSFFSPLRSLFEKDVFITLFFGAVVYAVWSMVTSSTTAMLEIEYNLFNRLYIGLCFLPNGAGCVVGSLTTGKIMDWNYRRVSEEFKKANGITTDATISHKTHENFPIELARLKNSWVLVLIFVVTTGLYGWSLELHIAIPLILQFFIAYTATAIFSINSALIIDLYPAKSASATAVNNLIRCTIGAIGVSVVQYIIDAIDAGAGFLILAGFTGLLTPLLTVELRWGPTWRREREHRLAQSSKASAV